MDGDKPCWTHRPDVSIIDNILLYSLPFSLRSPGRRGSDETPRTNTTEPIVVPHKVSRGAFVASYLAPDNHVHPPMRADTLSEFLNQTPTKPGGETSDSAGFNLSSSEPRPSMSSEDKSRSSLSFDAVLLRNPGSQTEIRARPLHPASTDANCLLDGTST